MLSATDIMRQTLNTGRLDILTGAAFSPHQVNKAAVESGQAMGFTLQVMEDPMAQLQNSMEELSFQFEEKEMKSIGERKIGDKHGPRSAYLSAVEGWQKVMPDMPGGEFMERMLRNLRQMQRSGQQPDIRQLLNMLGEGSSDPSHQFAMLDVLEQALGPGDEELAQLVKNAKQHLENTKGPEIKAGINLAQEINSQAANPEEMRDLRDLYRSEVLGFSSPQNCFRSLLASRGAGGLAAGLDFLVKGCSIDIQSATPSQSPEELRRILLDLQCVDVLRTMMDKSDRLLGKMASQFGEQCLLNGEGMTGELLDFTEMSFVSATNIANFIAECGIKALPAQIYFCTDLIGLFRDLSSRLFAEEEDRGRLIDAGQEHLDGLVERQMPNDEQETSGGRQSA